MKVESFSENITCWGAVVFVKWVNNVVKKFFVSWDENYFYHLQTYFHDIFLLISQKLQHLSK